MQVTCVHCGMEAAVTPEFHQCRHCQGDLAALVTAEFKATYYFQKAQESAAQGASFVALEQIQRGLQAQNRSDLHLLAAIMYADLGREEQLRMHIGAIPTDDVLRPEAESLLKQLAQRRGTGNPEAIVPPISDNRRTGLGPRLMASIFTMAIVLVIIGTVTQTQSLDSFQFNSWLPRGMNELFGGTAGQIRDFLQPVQQSDVFQLPAESLPEEVANAEDAGLPTPDTVAESMQAEPQSVPSVAEPAPELNAEKWRESVTQNVMGLIARETIDFTQILVDRGLTELEGSEIVGVIQGNHLVLIGSVESEEAKQSVLAAVSEFKGVGGVDALGLQVVLPLRSHVIQQGESLWGIAEEYLGEGSLWVEIVALNQDLELGALRAGETLIIPAQPSVDVSQ